MKPAVLRCSLVSCHSSSSVFFLSVFLSPFSCFSFTSYFFLSHSLCLSLCLSHSLHSFSKSLALHLYPPLCHTFSLSLPADFALPCVPPLIFSMAFLGASSLFPLSSSSLNHATQHIWRQRRLTEPRLSPCVAATTAVNLVQTRCLFYSLALSRGRKKKRERPNKKAKGLLVFLRWESSSLHPK